MRYARMSDGYRLATSALTTRVRDAGAKRCSAAPLCGVRSPAACAGSAVSCAQIRANEQRVDHARCRAGVGQPLVAARRHARERERGAAEHARQRARPRRRRRWRSAERDPDRCDRRRRSGRREISSRSGPAMPRCRATALSPWPGSSRVEKSYRRTASSVSMNSRPGATSRTRRRPSSPPATPRARRSLSQSARLRARPSASGTPRRPRATVEEGQVEAVQVVVLDHVGIGGARSSRRAGE